MSGGIKHDQGKLRMDLIPMDSLRDLASVYTMGAQKYADENWRQGISWKRIYGAILRHLSLWFLGQDVDEESGLSHLAHAAWGCFTLLNYARTHQELDDRPIAYAGGDTVAGADAPNGHSQQPGHPDVPPKSERLVPAPSTSKIPIIPLGATADFTNRKGSGS